MDTTEVISIEEQTIGCDELVDSHIAAKILGLSARTVRDMGTKRVFPVYKIGARSNRFLVRDLLEWCEERRCEKI